MEGYRESPKKEFGKELGFIHEGLITLRKAGMTKELWALVTEKEELSKKVVAFIQQYSNELTTSQKQAREIMGKNFLGVEEVAEYFDIVLTLEELTEITEIPFSKTTLEECKDTHILFLGLPHNKEGKPLTINCFKKMFPANGQPRFYSYQDYWYEKEKTDITDTKETPELQWYLIRKTIIEESISKTYKQQEKLFKKNEYREKAIVYVYGILLMFKAMGERLFEKDFIQYGVDSVGVGGFNPGGITTGSWWDGKFYIRCLGIAPARKFD